MIFCIVAMIMLGIGFSQLKSKEPVGFYTGEKLPKVDQLSDVNSWNKKHGVMWIIYGICIIGSWICSAFIGGSADVMTDSCPSDIMGGQPNILWR